MVHLIAGIAVGVLPRQYSLAVVVRTILILAIAYGASAQSLNSHLARRERSASQADPVVRNGTILPHKPRILLTYDMEGISNVDRLSMVKLRHGRRLPARRRGTRG